MSRECARQRALQQAARLEPVLQSRDRIELFGYAITKTPNGAGATDVERSDALSDELADDFAEEAGPPGG